MSQAKDLYEKGQDALFHCDLCSAEHALSDAALEYIMLALKSVGTMTSNTNLLNAAICHFLANNHYAALDVIENKIRIGKLSSENKIVLENLRVEAHRRKRKSYWDARKSDLVDMKRSKDHASILVLLKENPWVLNSRELALQFRDSCLALGMEEVANLFEHDSQEL